VPGTAARRGARPRRSRAGRHGSERDGPEQVALGATRRQLDADACDVLDHGRADLDQALPDRCELSRRKGARLRDRGAHASPIEELGRQVARAGDS
jgi:hypothetical protein